MVKRKSTSNSAPNSKGKSERQAYIDRQRGIFNRAIRGGSVNERRIAARRFIGNMGSLLTDDQARFIQSHVASGASMNIADNIWNTNRFGDIASRRYSQLHPEDQQTDEPLPKAPRVFQTSPHDYEKEDERLRRKTQDAIHAIEVQRNLVRAYDVMRSVRHKAVPVSGTLKNIDNTIRNRGEKLKKISKISGVFGKIGKIGGSILGGIGAILTPVFPPAGAVLSAVGTGLSIGGGAADIVSGTTGAIGGAMAGDSGEEVVNNAQKAFSGISNAMNAAGLGKTKESQDCEAVAKVQVEAFNLQNTKVPSDQERRELTIQHLANVLQSPVAGGTNIDGVSTETMERGVQGISGIKGADLLLSGGQKVFEQAANNLHNVNIKNEPVNMPTLNAAQQVIDILMPHFNLQFSNFANDVRNFVTSLHNSQRNDMFNISNSIREHFITSDQLMQNLNFYNQQLEAQRAETNKLKQDFMMLSQNQAKGLEKQEEYQRRMQDLNENQDNLIKQIRLTEERTIKNERFAQEQELQLRETKQQLPVLFDRINDVLNGKANTEAVNASLSSLSQNFSKIVSPMGKTVEELKILYPKLEENIQTLNNQLAGGNITEEQRQQLETLSTIQAKVKNLSDQLPILAQGFNSCKQQCDQTESYIREQSFQTQHFLKSNLDNIATEIFRADDSASGRQLLRQHIEESNLSRQSHVGIAQNAQEDMQRVARILQLAENYENLGPQTTQALGEWIENTDQLMPYYIGVIDSNYLLQIANQIDRVAGTVFNKNIDLYNRMSTFISSNKYKPKSEEITPDIEMDWSQAAKALADAVQEAKILIKQEARQQTRPQVKEEVNQQAQTQVLQEQRIPSLIQVSYDMMNARPEKRRRVNAASAQGMHLVGGRPDPRLDFVDFWKNKIAAFRTGKRYPRKYY